jgi:hypothetical protein
MALPHMGGLERSLAFSILLEQGKPCEPADVTALLSAYDRWLADRPVKVGVTDLWTYTRVHYRPLP